MYTYADTCTHVHTGTKRQRHRNRETERSHCKEIAGKNAAAATCKLRLDETQALRGSGYRAVSLCLKTDLNRIARTRLLRPLGSVSLTLRPQREDLSPHSGHMLFFSVLHGHSDGAGGPVEVLGD